MFPRINFLLGLGLLLLITFYFAGLYLIILPLSLVAPDWVKPVAGVLVLAAVGITVQLLSMAMGDLRGIGLYRAGERPGFLNYASQTFMLLGHLGSIYFASGLLREGKPIATLAVLLVGGLYLAGVALAIAERQARLNARTG